jgi:hypothetical protein
MWGRREEKGVARGRRGGEREKREKRVVWMLL